MINNCREQIKDKISMEGKKSKIKKNMVRKQKKILLLNQTNREKKVYICVLFAHKGTDLYYAIITFEECQVPTT